MKIRQSMSMAGISISASDINLRGAKDQGTNSQQIYKHVQVRKIERLCRNLVLETSGKHYDFHAQVPDHVEIIRPPCDTGAEKSPGGKEVPAAQPASQLGKSSCPERWNEPAQTPPFPLADV
jgi:hypothetical protein